MQIRQETIFEKVISPLPITCVCFFGFMAYIYVYIQQLAQPDLSFIISLVIALSCLLMFRGRFRPLFCKGNIFRASKVAILSTPDETFERYQRQKDKDARYFGMIIFILSAMYLLFLEVV